MTMSATYRIAEVARRSGFPLATLRYYDDIGLLPAPARTAAGYRLYDDRSLELLAFVARAKRLGCSLEEITELASAWAGGVCGPLQDRLRRVVDAKLADARGRLAETQTFIDELQRAASSLAGHTPDGPCDDQCGCPVTSGAAEQPAAVVLTAKPVPGTPTAPIACTLDGAGALEARVAEWQAVLADVTTRTTIDGGLRLEFGPDAPIGDIAALTVAEQGCCRFFTFALTVDSRGVALEVRAPESAADLVTDLFGPAR